MSEFQMVSESELQSVEGGALWMIAAGAGAVVLAFAVGVAVGVALATP